MALTTRAVLFTASDGQQTVLSGENLEQKMSDLIWEIIGKLPTFPRQDFLGEPDENIEKFARDYQHVGRFSEPFLVPIDATYIISGEEGRKLFEEKVGRPPTETEFERLCSKFADALAETGVWDTLAETVEEYFQ